MKKEIFKINQINEIPHTTGVYCFLDKNKNYLYIGKSVNVYARIKSHIKASQFDKKEKAIIKKTHFIEIYPTDSEFASIILEAQLIQKKKPYYNKIWKDDKSYLYIKITNEKYPKVLPVRQKDLSNSNDIFHIGPFDSLRMINSLLRLLRRIVPFCTQKKLGKTKCFYSKIGLCNPCPSEIEKIKDINKKQFFQKQYRKNIQTLIKLLKGQTDKIENDLLKKIKKYSQEEKFEEAIELREKLKNLYRLKHLQFIEIYPEENLEKFKKLKQFAKYELDIKNLRRIECYDISNLADKYITASMVVMENGILNKNEYRKFRSKIEKQDDFNQIVETLRRRFLNNWRKPDLIVLDGGAPQIKLAEKFLKENKINTKIIGIAKKPDRIIYFKEEIKKTIKINSQNDFLSLIVLLRDEAHRFAKKYHLYLRRKDFIKQKLNI